MMEFLASSVKEQFLGDWQMALVRSSDQYKALLEFLVQAGGIAPLASLDQI
jgi:hypothetical protein